MMRKAGNFPHNIEAIQGASNQLSIQRRYPCFKVIRPDGIGRRGLLILSSSAEEVVFPMSKTYVNRKHIMRMLTEAWKLVCRDIGRMKSLSRKLPIKSANIAGKLFLHGAQVIINSF